MKKSWIAGAFLLTAMMEISVEGFADDEQTTLSFPTARHSNSFNRHQQTYTLPSVFDETRGSSGQNPVQAYKIHNAKIIRNIAAIAEHLGELSLEEYVNVLIEHAKDKNESDPHAAASLIFAADGVVRIAHELRSQRSKKDAVLALFKGKYDILNYTWQGDPIQRVEHALRLVDASPLPRSPSHHVGNPEGVSMKTSTGQPVHGQATQSRPSNSHPGFSLNRSSTPRRPEHPSQNIPHIPPS